MIMDVLSHPVVLSYPRCASLSARWRLPLVDDAASLRPMVRPVTDRRFSSRVVSRSLRYDIIHHLGPLLYQSDKGLPSGVIR
jgi:hypothetical protein